MSIWDEIKAEQENVPPGPVDGFIKALDRAYDETLREMPNDEFRANLIRVAACAVAWVENIDKEAK